jgi:hypothetical protein
VNGASDPVHNLSKWKGEATTVSGGIRMLFLCQGAEYSSIRSANIRLRLAPETASDIHRL